MKWLSLGLLCAVIFSPGILSAQEYDTISNWDAVTPDWYVSTGGSEIVLNPSPGEVNPSERCFRVVSGAGMWDYMLLDLDEAANFDLFPRYRVKVMAPLTGGDVALKFENYNNTFSHEIIKTPVPGQWNDLEFDFSGLTYGDLTRMVIFWDFQGMTTGISWYFDDVLKEIPGPLQLLSNLPIVVINTDGVSIPDEPKITAHMGIIDNGPGMINSLSDPFNNYDGFIGIEIRGQSTQMFPKKSYAFETRDGDGENLDVSILGMPEENDWVLYAPYTDKSMLRNVVTFDMGRKMGHYCTRTVYCELVLNNDYRGVYVMMEKIKKDENRVDIATLKPDEITGDDLTGGYIIRVDKVDWDFVFGVDGWKSNPFPAYPNAMDIIFQYDYPDPDEIVAAQRTYIKDFITVAENTLTSTNFTDPENGYQKYFDVLSFIDFMLLSEISKEVDKYRYSNYFYKEKDSDGGKLFAGPAWDFNLGYGNVDYWEPGIDFTGWAYTRVEPHEASVMFWWKRLMEDPYFQNMVKTRYAYLRQHRLADDEIHAVIDSILVLIDEAKDRNYQRWPILGEYVWPNYNWYGNTYEDEVEYFEGFLFNRLHWMDYNLPGTINHPWAGISASANTINVTLHGDYFSLPTLKKEHFRLNNAPDGVYIQAVTYKNTSECSLNLTAVVTGYPQVSVTIQEEAVNYWEDITSSDLGSTGMEDSRAELPLIHVWEENHHVHIRCTQPELLPEYATIFSMAGQRLGILRLEKISENVLPHRFYPAIYLLVMEMEHATSVEKLLVR